MVLQNSSLTHFTLPLSYSLQRSDVENSVFANEVRGYSVSEHLWCVLFHQRVWRRRDLKDETWSLRVRIHILPNYVPYGYANRISWSQVSYSKVKVSDPHTGNSEFWMDTSLKYWEWPPLKLWLQTCQVLLWSISALSGHLAMTSMNHRKWVPASSLRYLLSHKTSYHNFIYPPRSSQDKFCKP